MSVDWALIGIPGFAFIAYAWYRARAIGARNAMRRRVAQQWLHSHDRGEERP